METVTLKPSTGKDMMVVLGGIHRRLIPASGVSGPKDTMLGLYSHQVENGNLVMIEHSKIPMPATGPKMDALVEPIDAEPPVAGPSETGANFGCPYCDKGYERISNLEAHVKAKHPGYPIPVAPDEPEDEANDNDQ